MKEIQYDSISTFPFFCVPGAGDSVVNFHEPASAMGDEQTVHGLQPRGTDGVLVPYCSVASVTVLNQPYVQTLAKWWWEYKDVVN